MSDDALAHPDDTAAAVAITPRLGDESTSVGMFYRMHMMGAIFPLTAGMFLYGWRALVSIAVVVTSAWMGVLIWRRVGRRGSTLQSMHAMWFALLLALTLPAHLLRESQPSGTASVMPWMILPATGLMIAILLWLLGGLGASRIHPVLVGHLLLIVLLRDVITSPHWVLQRDHVFTGDLMKTSDSSHPMRDGWNNTLPIAQEDALYVKEPAAERLTKYTTNTDAPPVVLPADTTKNDALFASPVLSDKLARHASETMDRVLDSLPALEDLAIGGHPAPIGAGSAIAVIIGGLFLLYRSLIDYRIPLLIVAACYLTLFVLPIPVHMETGTRWYSLAHQTWNASLSMESIFKSVTFANYEIMASPILFMGFFLATAPAVRPMTRRARTVFALACGVLTATLQIYLSVSYGPYLALLLASLMTPYLDHFFPARPLV